MNHQQKEVVDTLNEYIPNLINGVLNAIDKINKNKLNDTIKMVSDIIEGSQWVKDAFNLAFQEQNLQIEDESFNVLLSGIVKSYEDEDSILSKDLLKYEMIPLLKNIKQILEQF